jgi:ribosomal protein S18 acetylase RimI-like enzyme
MSEKQNLNNYIIRHFRDEDYDEVNHLWESLGLGGKHRGDNLQIIKNTLEAGGCFYILEFVPNKKIIGTAWITNDKRRLYLHHFGIHSDFQGLKLSHLLMEKCIEYGKMLNLQMKLEVHKTNVKAIELYKKYQFKSLGDYEVYIIREYKK